MSYAGAHIQVYLHEVANRRLVLLNDPQDHIYYPTETGPKLSGVDFADRGYPTAGNVLWLADHVVVTPLANHGPTTGQPRSVHLLRGSRRRRGILRHG